MGGVPCREIDRSPASSGFSHTNHQTEIANLHPPGAIHAF
jgi:hypothetical protein